MMKPEPQKKATTLVGYADLLGSCHGALKLQETLDAIRTQVSDFMDPTPDDPNPNAQTLDAVVRCAVGNERLCRIVSELRAQNIALHEGHEMLNKRLDAANNTLISIWEVLGAQEGVECPADIVGMVVQTLANLRGKKPGPLTLNDRAMLIDEAFERLSRG